MLLRKAIFAALEPPVDADVFLEAVPELSLARGLEGSPYHHLDTLDHVLEVVRRVEEELDWAELDWAQFLRAGQPADGEA